MVNTPGHSSIRMASVPSLCSGRSNTLRAPTDTAVPVQAGKGRICQSLGNFPPFHKIEFVASGFDELCARAWPAPECDQWDGWELRYGYGVTKRANSVLARRAPADLDAAVAAAERFYGGRQLPACFQVGGSSEPAGLDAALAARGYRQIDPTLLMTAPVAGVLALPAGLPLEISEVPTDEWVALWQRVDGRYPPDLLPRAVQIMTGVPAGYGLLRAAGGTA